METGNEKYDKLIRIIREQEPVPENIESIADRVMDHIRKEKERKSSSGIMMALFGWAYIAWSRNILALGASLMVLFFVYQHISLFSKVQQLEDRLLRSTYNYYESPSPSLQPLIRFVAPEDMLQTDSVKISKQDLLEFLQSYKDMEVNFDKLKESLQDQLRKQNRRENAGRKTSKNKTL